MTEGFIVKIGSSCFVSMNECMRQMTRVSWEIVPDRGHAAMWRKSTTGEGSLHDFHMGLGLAWNLGVSSRYSDFLVVIALKVGKVILNVIRGTTRNQCSSARTGVMGSRFLVSDTTRASMLTTHYNVMRFLADVS